MTAEQWKTGREKADLTQVAAARSLKVSQPYLSQLETGLRVSSADLARKAAKLYKLPPTALPLPEPLDVQGLHLMIFSESLPLSVTPASSMFVPSRRAIPLKLCSMPW